MEISSFIYEMIRGPNSNCGCTKIINHYKTNIEIHMHLKLSINHQSILLNNELSPNNLTLHYDHISEKNTLHNKIV